jgi:hypothetical protein
MNVATAREASRGLGRIALWTEGEGLRVTTSQSGHAPLIIAISWASERIPTRSNIFSWKRALRR